MDSKRIDVELQLCVLRHLEALSKTDTTFLLNQTGTSVSHRGVGRVPEEADHLGVRGRAGEGHVAVPEGAIDL